MRLILDNLVYETDNPVLIEKYKARGAVEETELEKVPDELEKVPDEVEKVPDEVDKKGKGKKAKADK